MSESYIKANGIRLAYEEFGSPSDPAMLLIMGLGTQTGDPDDQLAPVSL
jgi:hypothetical protein